MTETVDKHRFRSVKFFRALATNCVYLTFAYVGLLHGQQWAWNLLRFAMVLNLVMTSMMAVYCTKLPEKRIPRSKYDFWLSLTHDIVLMLFLAAMGHYVYATIVIMQQWLESSMYDQPKIT